MKPSWHKFCIPILLLIILSPLSSIAEGNPLPIRAGVYGIWLEPSSKDAEQFSKASLGFGVNLITVPKALKNLFASTIGFEYVEMKRQDIRIKDKYTGLAWEQQTRQIYRRFYLGGLVGHQGHGFFRPHAGANIALLYYSIYTDAVLDPLFEEEEKENLSKEGHFGFGYDFTLGVEFNYRNKGYLDLGVRYLHSLNIPQQLGDDSEPIYPQYVQFYVGIMAGFGD